MRQRFWDLNGGFGGPILSDRLWFYTAARTNGEDTYSGGFTNLNLGNLNSWTYAPDVTNPVFNHGVQTSLNARLTWQASAKNRARDCK